MDYQFNVNADGTERSFAWLSLQPDGAISVGLKDRTFVADSFRAQHFVWNYDNRIRLAYRVPNAPGATEPVENPHLTFHPPIMFHFRPNGGPDQFEAIAEPRLVIGDGETLPWVRYVSKPVNDLTEAKPPRDATRTSVELVTPSQPSCSIGLGIDFVPLAQQPVEEKLLSRCYDWGEVRIHVFCEQLPAQDSTLAWFHEC